MSFQEFKFNCFCVGGRHHSATTNIIGNEISKGRKIKIRVSSDCNRKIFSVITQYFGDNTIAIESLGEFSISIGTKTCEAAKKAKKTAINVLNESWESV